MCAMMRCEAAREYAACPQTFEIRLKCPVAEQPALLAGLQRYGKNRIIDDGLLNAATVTSLATPCISSSQMGVRSGGTMQRGIGRTR